VVLEMPGRELDLPPSLLRPYFSHQQSPQGRSHSSGRAFPRPQTLAKTLKPGPPPKPGRGGPDRGRPWVCGTLLRTEVGGRPTPGATSLRRTGGSPGGMGHPFHNPRPGPRGAAPGAARGRKLAPPRGRRAGAWPPPLGAWGPVAGSYQGASFLAAIAHGVQGAPHRKANGGGGGDGVGCWR